MSDTFYDMPGTLISKAASDNWRYMRGSIEEQGFKPKNQKSTYGRLTRAANKGYRDEAKKNPRRLLAGTASGAALGGIATRSPLGAWGGAAIGSVAGTGYGLVKSGKSQNNAFRGALQREIDAGRVTYRKPRKKVSKKAASDNRDLARGAAAGAAAGAGVGTAGVGGLMLHHARKMRIAGTSYKDMSFRPSKAHLKYIGTRAVLPAAAVGAAGGLAAAGANNRSRKKVTKQSSAVAKGWGAGVASRSANASRKAKMARNLENYRYKRDFRGAIARQDFEDRSFGKVRNFVERFDYDNATRSRRLAAPGLKTSPPRGRSLTRSDKSYAGLPGGGNASFTGQGVGNKGGTLVDYQFTGNKRVRKAFAPTPVIDHGTEISKYEVSKGLKEWKQGYQNKKRAHHLKRADKWTKRWHDLDADTSMPYKKFQRKQMKAYDNLDYHREKLRTMGFDEYGRKMVSKYYSEVRPASRGELEAKRKLRPIQSDRQ